MMRIFFFPGEFIGLYGNNDGIKDNDLISRNGTLINSNASMIDIHNQFGLTCKCVCVCVCVCVNIEVSIKKGQSREPDNIVYTRRRKQYKKKQ